MDDFYNTYKPKHCAEETPKMKSETGENRNIPKSGNGFTVNTDCVGNESGKSQEAVKPTLTEEVFEWLDVLVTAIISVVIIFTLLFRIATIDGPSMQNTLFTGNKVIISNLSYEPKQGDIVVVSRNIQNSVETEEDSDAPIIKRVIAVAGQTVDIDFNRGVVSVDGVELKEDYTKTLTTRSYEVQFPVIVPDGCIFVLGDNRDNSLDSRSSQIGNNGMIDTRYVLGHALFRVFPFNEIGRLK